jgi:hypothetical protein
VKEQRAVQIQEIEKRNDGTDPQEFLDRYAVSGEPAEHWHWNLEEVPAFWNNTPYRETQNRYDQQPRASIVKGIHWSRDYRCRVCSVKAIDAVRLTPLLQPIQSECVREADVATEISDGRAIQAIARCSYECRVELVGAFLRRALRETVAGGTVTRAYPQRSRHDRPPASYSAGALNCSMYRAPSAFDPVRRGLA